MDPYHTHTLHTIDGLDITLWAIAAVLLWLLLKPAPRRQEPEPEIEPATKANLPEGFFEGDGGPL